MKRLLSVSLATSMFLSTLYASEELKKMFTDANASGELRAINAVYNQDDITIVDTYATALGGKLKYELAQYYGFNAGFAVSTSKDIAFATGDRSKNEQNDELSSSKGEYTQLSEAYVNYSNSGFNIRSGRQHLDTPLADSDDIRMIANTFEADILSYESASFSFMAGNIREWQGVDVGLDDGWQKTGTDGTWFVGLTYSDEIELNVWYYNISDLATARYMDIGVSKEFYDDYSISVGVQYLSESELSDSNTTASIYGAIAEFTFYNFGISAAYNISNKFAGKKSFSGFGGGIIYAGMDTMIIDEITEDRSASSTVIGLNYEIYNVNMFYAYGDFIGEANSAGIKAHIVEYNAGFEYSYDNQFTFSVIYAREQDMLNEQKNQYDWNRIQTTLAYIF